MLSLYVDDDYHCLPIHCCKIAVMPADPLHMEGPSMQSATAQDTTPRTGEALSEQCTSQRLLFLVYRLQCFQWWCMLGLYVLHHASLFTCMQAVLLIEVVPAGGKLFCALSWVPGSMVQTKPTMAMPPLSTGAPPSKRQQKQHKTKNITKPAAIQGLAHNSTEQQATEPSSVDA